MEKLCDMCDITVNKNTIYGDLSAFNPGGIRIGTCALTSRSMLEEDFTKVANILHEIVNLAIIIQEKSGKKLVDFLEETKLYNEQIMKIKNNVNTIALNFDLPGI